MKVLVTGGSGFIGSHIVDRLINDGHKVIVIDDNSADNEKFYTNPKASYFNESVQDFYNIKDIFIGVDVVFHLAAESRIQPCINNPIMANLANVVGTCSVLQAAREANVKRVIFSSTSAAYGLANTPPFTEDMNVDCLNPYSTTKVAGEELCKMFYRLYGLETVIFRYFNVYGERHPSKGQYAPVIAIFERQLKENDLLTVIGDGLQSRDFVHVSDIVSANIAAALSDDKKILGQVFNIGTGKSYTVMDLVWMMAGEEADFMYLPKRVGEARCTEANIGKAKTLLKWEPKIDLKEWINENISTISNAE